MEKNITNNTNTSSSTDTTIHKIHNDIEDGIYAEFFVIKDGVRYNINVLNLREVSSILTNSLLDGLEKLYNKGE